MGEKTLNRKILAAAVAVASTLPAASALALDGAKGSNVTIYGRFQIESTNITDSDGDKFGCTTCEPWYMNDIAPGRFGFLAKEKIGDGLQAVGKFEYGTDTSDNTGVSGRTSYIGVKSDSWGFLWFGEVDGAYKVTGGHKADFINSTTMEARNAGGISSGKFGHSSRNSKTANYASPNWAGFSFRIQYNPENSDAAGDKSGFYNLGVQYKNGPIWVWGGYSDQKDVDTADVLDQNSAGVTEVVTNDDRRRWKLGGRLTFGNHKLNLQFEKAKGYGEELEDNSISARGGLPAEGTGADANFYWLQYDYKFGNNDIIAGFGRADFDSNNTFDTDGNAVFLDDYDYDAYTLAFRHKFSKTFKAWIGGRYLKASDIGDDDQDNDIKAFSIGMRKDWKI
jgi:predicted porin